MILTGEEIKLQIQKGNIVIEPFSEKELNPNSYNYRLGNKILAIEDSIIDPIQKSAYKIIEIPKDGFCLQPNRLYLANTMERIGSDVFVTTLIGRSSVGRLGLFLQITASLGHVGAIHNWTLELKCVQPIIVYKGMKIGQVSFWNVEGESKTKYKGKYGLDKLPHVSRYYSEVF